MSVDYNVIGNAVNVGLCTDIFLQAIFTYSLFYLVKVFFDIISPDL